MWINALGSNSATSAEARTLAGNDTPMTNPLAESPDTFRKSRRLNVWLSLCNVFISDLLQLRSGISNGFGVTGIAYETVELANGTLPLLTPMSEVAGRLAPQVGAWTLQKANGGRGVLMGGVPGVGPAKVAVIGGGVWYALGSRWS